jgi:hypothetical protein
MGTDVLLPRGVLKLAGVLDFGWQTARRRLPCLDNAVTMGDLFALLSAAAFAELEKVLTKLGAKLSAREVHALYLGAMTSTSFRLGPQHLGRPAGARPGKAPGQTDASAAGGSHSCIERFARARPADAGAPRASE